jgi:hypothetical protein
LVADAASLTCRRGVAQALVQACEAVAAAAGFLDIYIQAATISRDSASPLGSWLSQEYTVSASLVHNLTSTCVSAWEQCVVILLLMLA